MAKRHKKLPPKSKPGDGSQTGSALARIKEIHAVGGKPTPENWQRPTSLKVPTGAVLTKKNGKIVWRIPGKAGAASEHHPLAIEAIRAEQAYFTEINKQERQGRLQQNGPKGAKNSVTIREKKGLENRSKVIALAEKYAHLKHNLAAYIAKKTGLSARRVHKILEEKRNSTETARLSE